MCACSLLQISIFAAKQTLNFIFQDFLIYVYACVVCMAHMGGCPPSPEEGVGSPVTGDRGSCNQPDVVNGTLVP